MSKKESINWYQLPLYYDIVFDEDSDLEADALDAIFERYADGKVEKLFEPACGTGRLMIEMARRGYTCHGSDLTEAMLKYAEQRRDKILSDGQDLEESQLDQLKFSQADMTQFTLPAWSDGKRKADASFCLVSTFKYLLTDEAVMGHMRCMAEAIRKGGLYILGFHQSDEAQDQPMRERWTGERAGVHVVSNIYSWPPEWDKRQEKVRVRLKVREPGVPGEKTYETHWVFRTYDADQMNDFVNSIKPWFEVQAIYNFTYSLLREHSLDDSQLDRLFVLKRV